MRIGNGQPQRQLTSERYNRFLDPNEMTVFPRFDDGFPAPQSIFKRNSPHTPYRGYFADLQSVEQNMMNEPSQTLINSYLSQSWSSTPVTSFVETNVIRRNITFKERMADKLYRRISRRFCKLIFDEWYKYSFRYTMIRRNLLACYNMTYLSRRFFAWRYVAHLSVCFRKCLKIFWKRIRRSYFRWWKVWTTWEAEKERLCRQTFRQLQLHAVYQSGIRYRWTTMIRTHYRLHCVRVIQRSYRWHRMRRFFWANRVIKKLFMDYFIIWLIRRRKRREKKRAQQEELAIQQMISRSDLYLRKFLQCHDGKEMTWTYLHEINVLWKDKKIRDKIFPTKEEMPEIDMKWTVRGKAMHILRHRTIEEVSDWARAQFRQSCPPCYLCPRCQAVFSLKVIAREHKLSCLYVKDPPHYLSWKLCESIVNASLKPLVALFYGKEAAARAERKEAEQIQKQKSRRLLQEALTGTDTRPEHEEVKTKPKKSDLRVF
jgi:hypothetical protein